VIVELYNPGETLESAYAPLECFVVDAAQQEKNHLPQSFQNLWIQLELHLLWALSIKTTVNTQAYYNFTFLL
jgi:hypothetical protein